MRDDQKTRRQLIEEMEQLRRRVAELEARAESGDIETAQRESEELYRKLFGSSKDAIMTLAPPSWKFTSGNPTILDMFRVRNLEEWTRLGPLDVSPERQPDGRLARDKAAEMIRIAMENGSHYFEWQHQRLDGEPFPATVLLTRVDLTDDVLLQATVRDVTREKKALAELKASEERFRKLSSLTFEGILLHDEGVAIDVNESLLTLLGYSRQELIGKNIIQMCIPSEYHPLVFEKLASENADPYEIEMLRKGGACCPVEVVSRDVADERGEFRVAAIRDISQRKIAEEALKRIEDRLRIIIKGTRACLFSTSFRGKFTYLNEAACDILQGSHDELLGTFYLRYVHPDDQERVHTAFYNQMKTGIDSVSIEFRFVGLRGRIGWFSFLVNPLWAGHRVAGLTGIAQNITERREAEQRVKEAQEFMEAAIAQSTAGILIADAPDVKIRLANRAAFGIRGGSEDILTGIEVQEHAARWQTFFPDGRPYPSEELPLSRAVLKGESTHDEEVIIRDEDGVDHWVIVNAAPVRDSEGNVTAGIVVFHDITERRQALEERERLEEQLHQSQKMESVGRLAGGVAHDFNNMLSVILGYAELAIVKTDSGDPIQKPLREIINAAARSSELVSQLLAFARRQTVTPKVLDLNDFIPGTLKMLRRLIGEDIDLTWQPGRNLWPVNIDPSQADQILANLAVNARDAITGVGKVAIWTENHTVEADSEPDSPEAAPGDYVVVCVKDNGCGMDDEVQANLFEPFFTTKEVGEGTGLGLATVYGIVRQNDGFITVDSSPGQGSTFCVYIPCYQGAGERSRDNSNDKQRLRGTETVLIVEDEPSILELGSLLLENYGYTVLTADNPIKALTLVENTDRPVDLLLSDVVMPEMNGRSLADKLLKKYPDMKLLFMSGYTSNVIAPHGVLDDDVHFLQKPFTAKSLASKVREVLDDAATN